jgi:hypothetical protein
MKHDVIVQHVKRFYSQGERWLVCSGLHQRTVARVSRVTGTPASTYRLFADLITSLITSRPVPK